jgi:xanthine dehydrogenase accessory factor
LVEAAKRLGMTQPRVSALLRPAQQWTIRVSSGRGYFAPTPFTEETEATGLTPVAPLGELRAERRPFVLATVTVSQRPTSARAGSRAIITRDGALFGWVGGACSQPAVVRQALETLATGEPRVLRLSPEAEDRRRDGVIELPMTCHSGGTFEVFLEPFLPAPYLIVVGDSPVAQAVADLGGRFDLDVIHAYSANGLLSHRDESHADAEQPDYIFIATMGNDDEIALENALALQPAYIGLVGSRRRFAAIADYLRSNGVAEPAIASIHAPAGLDIGAQTPHEIALSILSEIVQARRTVAPELRLISADEPKGSLVIDPVCGMSVDLSSTRHTLEVDGVTYGFCCPACKRRYEQERAAG